MSSINVQLVYNHKSLCERTTNLDNEKILIAKMFNARAFKYDKLEINELHFEL